MKGVLAGNHQLADGHRIGIVLVVGISSILVDDSAIGGTSVQEVKRHMEVSCLFIGDAANEPAVTATFLTGYGDMFSYLSMGDEGLAPRRRTTLNKRQGGLTFVVFDGIGSHLQRTVDNHKLAQLFGQRTVGMRASNYFREVKDGGGEVGRSCQAAREGQRNGMGRGITSSSVPRIILLTTHTFLCHQVGPCALDACGHSGLVVVDHDVVLGGTLDDATIVADAILRLGQFLTIKEMAHITCLHRTDAHLAEPGKG